MANWLKKAWQSRWTPAAVVLILLAGWYIHRKTEPRQTFQLDGEMLVRGNPTLHEVCLTFDDGPHPESMNKILDVLKEENVRATFFVVGKVVDLHPELVRRMMAEGHEVGNHTYSHKRLNQMPIASAKQEIAACASSVRRATGAGMTLLRPPGMEFDNDVLHLAEEMGYVTVHWNVVAADYVPVAPATIVNRVMNQVKDGSVILLHDSPDTALALRAMIHNLRAKGFRFVTTTQMLARLPRPVNIASNAYAVKPPVVVDQQVPLKVARKKVDPIVRPAPVQAKPAPSERRRPVLDTPVWDGHDNRGSGDSGRELGSNS